MFPNEHAIPKCAVCTDWILISLQILCTPRDCKKKSLGVLPEWGHNKLSLDVSSLFCMHRCMELPKQRIHMGQPGFGATMCNPDISKKRSARCRALPPCQHLPRNDLVRMLVGVFCPRKLSDLPMLRGPAMCSTQARAWDSNDCHGW